MTEHINHSYITSVGQQLPPIAAAVNGAPSEDLKHRFGDIPLRKCPWSLRGDLTIHNQYTAQGSSHFRHTTKTSMKI